MTEIKFKHIYLLLFYIYIFSKNLFVTLAVKYSTLQRMISGLDPEPCTSLPPCCVR